MNLSREPATLVTFDRSAGAGIALNRESVDLVRVQRNPVGVLGLIREEYPRLVHLTRIPYQLVSLTREVVT